jgi:ubiquinone/menaquinone biosynthesis C-methylase UbiE
MLFLRGGKIMLMSKTEMTPELTALKTKLKATWMAGDYSQVATHLMPEAEAFIGRLGLAVGDRVLDVACGTGNLALVAARTGAIVTGVDIAPNLLEQARARAAEAGLAIQFDEGDAEQLPYADAQFDTVVTMFGAMFAPRPERAAAELLRVCRPGGRIAMANWTAEGFVGDFFRVIARHVPPPPNVPSPLLWGKEEVVRERLGSEVTALQLTRRMLTFRFPFAAAEVVEFYRAYFGPVQQAFATLEADSQAALFKDQEKLWGEHNQATDGTTVVDAEYLEVVAVRR